MKQTMKMTEGSLADKIFFFALPLAASSILQQLFNSADVAVVGNFAGSNALGAVGANGSVINLLVNTFVGISIGSNVVIATLIGQNKEKKAKQAVHTSMLFAVILGVILMAFGLLIAPQLLRLMATPSNILSLAVLYLRIYFLGVPFIVLYNFEAAILRSRGETRLPLIALSIAGVINVILNLVFVVGLGMSVDGVAYATVISNIFSSLFLLIYLTHDTTITHFTFKQCHIHKDLLLHILKIGIPSGMQGALFSISNVIIQSQLNQFGSYAIAGSAAALNFEILSYYFFEGFGQAAITFVGQNYGAGKMDRCHQVLKYCWMEASVVTIVSTILFVAFARPLASIFSSDPHVLDYAVRRMYILITFEILNMSIEILSGAMRGFGYAIVPTLVAVFGICVSRIIWVFTIAKMIHSYEVLLYCYPVSWLLTSIASLIAYKYLTRKLV
ncbi:MULTISPECIES: MATE family efflux transporter [Sharpea]|jgi:putative MATE family efflux protein|uniref:Probable multidrug resistance protein NorM n=1 Tax=Sharpea azabuensis TaxID=322505 RepID=A0A1H6RQS5_9FIRM|nr:MULTISPECIES: MATE family efflux transporter [Sharpea]HAJ14704.1 MATE family efflux transporter [Erysipelotrichaceae bacterium]MDY5280089.1 MATE family efflux transporter [Sharpea porci]MEE3309013.1 MATE family efflux transporter [Sharpea azabuensis]SEI55754.1 putative efflux protein, MATE family [Sharpea azabuensis]SFE34497.1 putative efflux protein, MATE family [Sharpea azabuensis]